MILYLAIQGLFENTNYMEHDQKQIFYAQQHISAAENQLI
jgi:hypothetical protein